MIYGRRPVWPVYPVCRGVLIVFRPVPIIEPRTGELEFIQFGPAAGHGFQVKVIVVPSPGGDDLTPKTNSEELEAPRYFELFAKVWDQKCTIMTWPSATNKTRRLRPGPVPETLCPRFLC